MGMTEHEVVIKDLNERLDEALKARDGWKAVFWATHLELDKATKGLDEWKNATHATQLELDKANAKLERAWRESGKTLAGLIQHHKEK